MWIVSSTSNNSKLKISQNIKKTMKNQLKIIKNDNQIKDIFIDMDGVLADFAKSKNFQKVDKVMRKPPRMFEVGFFEGLDVLPGARWAIRVLLKNPEIKLHILTKPVFNSHICYSEKASWIAKHFPELLDSIIIAHDKKFCAGPGRVLIDDYPDEWKVSWEAAGGVFWSFNTDQSELEWLGIAKAYNPDYFENDSL